MRENEIWDVEGHADYLERCWGPGDKAGGRHWELLKSIAELVRGKTVLDTGCGMGHFYPILLKETPEVDYHGIDNSEKMLKKAHEFFPEETFRFTNGDIYDLSEFPIYDSVVSISVLMHLPEIEEPIKQMWSRTEKELIIETRVDEKGFLHKKPYSGLTILPENKKLIIRGIKQEDLFKIFGSLEGIGCVEVFYYDPRSSIYRLSRDVPKYGSFRRGWRLE